MEAGRLRLLARHVAPKSIHRFRGDFYDVTPTGRRRGTHPGRRVRQRRRRRPPRSPGSGTRPGCCACRGWRRRRCWPCSTRSSPATREPPMASLMVARLPAQGRAGVGPGRPFRADPAARWSGPVAEPAARRRPRPDARRPVRGGSAGPARLATRWSSTPTDSSARWTATPIRCRSWSGASAGRGGTADPPPCWTVSCVRPRTRPAWSRSRWTGDRPR